jgi:hypothetical protein
LKVRLIYSNPEENSYLNASVLMRSENIEATLDLFAEFSIALGRTKIKFGGVC